MIPLSLAEVAKVTGAVPDLVAEPGAVADRVVIDSRQAGPGALFAALPGQNVDGHDFAGSAVAPFRLRDIVGRVLYFRGRIGDRHRKARSLHERQIRQVIANVSHFVFPHVRAAHALSKGIHFFRLPLKQIVGGDFVSPLRHRH